MHHPSLLVLDEPTTGLDPRSRQIVWSTVRELVADGVTLLLTTQYLEEADALADRVVLIDHGRQVASGTAGELKRLVGAQRIDVVAADAAGPGGAALATQRALRGDGLSRGAHALDPRSGEVGDLAGVTEAVAATGVPVEELALRRPSLDDAFLALTGRPPARDEADEPVPAAEVA